MTYKVEQVFEAETLFEASIQVGGKSYLVIYGRHINGYYIALPQERIAAELTEPENTAYNAGKLTEAGLDKQVARAIASLLKDTIDYRQG